MTDNTSQKYTIVQNSIKLTMRLEVGHVEASQLETLAERIGDAILLFAEDFGDDENVVKEENFPLMKSCPLPTTGVGYFVESAVANESPVR